MPGKEVVILGSGDIGLIMARRMTLEGAKVKLVAEIMPYSGGLKRNIVQCLDDYDIPLKLNHTVIDIKGKERVESVTVAKVDENRKPISGTEEEIICDTLLLSCGLIPENELSKEAGVLLNPITSGPVVNESLETNEEGIFACGNVLHVHDLVDYVSGEAQIAGEKAAAYVKGKLPKPGTEIIAVASESGVRYTVPVKMDTARMEEEQIIRFRVDNIYRNACIAVYFNEKCVKKIKRPMLAPGEMEQVKLRKKDMEQCEGLRKVTIKVEQEEG